MINQRFFGMLMYANIEFCREFLSQKRVTQGNILHATLSYDIRAHSSFWPNNLAIGPRANPQTLTYKVGMLNLSTTEPA